MSKLTSSGTQLPKQSIKSQNILGQNRVNGAHLGESSGDVFGSVVHKKTYKVKTDGVWNSTFWLVVAGRCVFTGMENDDDCLGWEEVTKASLNTRTTVGARRNAVCERSIFFPIFNCNPAISPFAFLSPLPFLLCCVVTCSFSFLSDRFLFESVLSYSFKDWRPDSEITRHTKRISTSPNPRKGDVKKRWPL